MRTLRFKSGKLSQRRGAIAEVRLEYLFYLAGSYGEYPADCHNL